MTRSIAPHKRTKRGRNLNLESSCTYFFVIIANQISRRASKIYRDRFGFGVVEWRCLVVLAMEPVTSASRICELSNMNKSIVSRALAKLEDNGHIKRVNRNKNSKPRLVEMTVSGNKLHKDMLKVAIEREKRLRKGLSDSDIENFLRIVKIMRVNAEDPG